MPPIVIVQHIQYKGNNLAYLNGWPESGRVPLAGLRLSEGALLQHIIQLGTRIVSVPSERVLQTDEGGLPLVIGDVSIDYPVEEQVRVEYRYTRRSGAPVREWASQTFLVNPGEWAQVCYNGRFGLSHTDYWDYAQTVVNVGATLEPREDIFLRSEPTYRYRLISRLK